MHVQTARKLAGNEVLLTVIYFSWDVDFFMMHNVNLNILYMNTMLFSGYVIRECL